MADNNLTPSESTNLLQNNDVLYRIASFHYNETLGNLMEKNVFLCRPEDTVQAIAQTMAKRKISSVVVTDQDSRPVGIVTERDMVRKVVADGVQDINNKKIADIMTKNPVCLSPSDSLFESLSTFMRHTIKHLPIIQNSKVAGIITMRQIMKIRYSEPFVIIGELDRAESVADLKKIKNDLIHLVQEKLSSRVDPIDVLTMISLINFDIHKRLVKRVINDYGPPPADFCFFVTGSLGRRENLLFPDQDFCVIIEDYDDKHYNEFDNYFYEISKRFSDALNEAGFIYCPGNVMGQNPTWRKRISEWRLHLSYIFNRPGPFTVRYMTLIFDSSPLYGNSGLFDSYMDHAFRELSRNRNILRQMHGEEDGRHKVPLGLFNTFITEKGGTHKKEIDMKRSGLIFLIESARVLAMKNSIRETSTIKRIQALVAKGIIQSDDSEYFENAYRVILHHTLMAQADNYLHKGTANYYLNPHELSARSQELLKQAFKAISTLQDIVGSEFGELIL